MTGALARWRLAARLARREVRRHLGRSVLVVVVIALPLLATQAALLAYRSQDATLEARGSSTFTRGGAEELIDLSAADSHATEGYDPRLPLPPRPGAERTEIGFRIDDWVQGTTRHGMGPDDLVRAQAVALHTDPADLGEIEGRLPRDRFEAVITSDLAAATGREVGDAVRLIASRADITIVGILADLELPVSTIAVGPIVDGRDWVPDALIRIRGSGQVHVTAEMFELYWFAAGAPEAAAPDGDLARGDTSVRAESVVMGAGAAAIAVGFIAVTCSAAFAIGARRQLRQLGTLATAGAAPADLARAVLLQGSTLGAVGAVVATMLVYLGRFAAVRWIIDPAPLGGPVVPWVPVPVLGVALLGVVAGTLAALVPALSVRRIPALAALAGRRPASRRRPWSPWIGAAVLVGGLIALGLVTGTRHTDGRAEPGSAAGVVLAVLAVMGGVTAVAPALIAGVARLTGRARGTARLAGRSLSRDRMRSSAVVAASAVALGIPVVLLLWGARDLGPERGVSDEVQAVIDDAAEVSTYVQIVGAPDEVRATERRVRSILGDDVVAARPATIDGGTAVSAGPGSLDLLAVDPADLRALGDGRIADLLADDTVVRLDGDSTPPWIDDARAGSAPVGPIEEVAAADVRPVTLQLLLQAPGGLMDDPGPTPTGALAEEHLVLARPRPLTVTEEEQLTLNVGEDAPTIAELETLGGATAPSQEVSIYFTSSERGGVDVPWALIGVGLALLVALAVIGTSLALAAADGRSDDQVVIAVGAPPGVVRTRRALEATFTSAAAAVLGASVAGVATLIVIHSPTLRTHAAGPAVEIPLVDLAGATIVPVMAIGGCTWLAMAAWSRLRGRRDLVLVDG